MILITFKAFPCHNLLSVYPYWKSNDI